MTPPCALPRAFYLETERGQRFCLHHSPQNRAARGALVYIHPFAEEMNKSRRMGAVAARAFAAADFETLAIDLHGCGDSAGDFGDATWDGWVADVRDAFACLHGRSGLLPWLWGLRAGCLLALDAARAMDSPPLTPPLLLWQPPASGQAAAQQFLRLRLAADALRSPAVSAEQAVGRPDSARPNELTDDGEVAGYTLQPRLLDGLRRSRLTPPVPGPFSVWLETTTREPPSLLPATERAVAEWRAAGHAIRACTVAGPGFWQTQEIEEAPALVTASVEAVLAAQAHISTATHGA